MTKYWLCITNEENWRVIKNKRIWGVPKRHENTIKRVKKGDKCLIYLIQEKIGEEIKESRVTGAYEVTKEVFRDSTRIFKSPPKLGNETFPFRIKLKEIKVFDEPVYFKPLIPKLKFIKNKSKWAGHLMGKAMREIPEEDFLLILQEGAHTPNQKPREL